MVTALLRRLSLPLVVALLIVLAAVSLNRVYSGLLLVQLVAGAALGSVLVSVAAAADSGLAGRAVLGGGDARLRGVRDHRRRPRRRRPRRPAHARHRRRPQRGAAPAHRPDPGRAAARHGARAGRAGLARRLRRSGARRASPPAGDGAAAADAALRQCPGAGRAERGGGDLAAGRLRGARGARPRRRQRQLRRRPHLRHHGPGEDRPAGADRERSRRGAGRRTRRRGGRVAAGRRHRG